MRETVVAAMSGGVDSAVAAALLKAQGHEVIGVTLRVVPCAEDGSESPEVVKSQRCCTAIDVEDARRAAAALGIKHYVFNVKEEFKRDVLDPFLASYASGRTPIPCAPCNHAVKFGALLERAEELGAVAVATGHYARLDRDPVTGRWRLRRPRDLERDQTYFLHGVPREALARVRFPLAELTKPAVRAEAARLGLPVAAKPDSQEICFIPDGDTRGFLLGRLGARPGPIEDLTGRVLGEHQGVHLYTIGQRKGLGLESVKPWHVVALDADRNAVVVGDEADLYAPGCDVEALNRLADAWPDEPVTVRIRSRHAGAEARLEPRADGRLRIRFQTPQRSVTPGQAAVIYRGDEVIGGGTIAAALRPAAVR